MNILPDEILRLIIDELNIFCDFRIFRLCCVKYKSLIDSNDEYKKLYEIKNDKIVKHEVYIREYHYYFIDGRHEMMSHRLTRFEEIFIKICFSHLNSKLYHDMYEHIKLKISSNDHCFDMVISDVNKYCLYGIIKNKDKIKMKKFYELYKCEDILAFVGICIHYDFIEGIKFFFAIDKLYNLDVFTNHELEHEVIMDHIYDLLKKNNIEMIKLLIDVLINLSPYCDFITPAQLCERFNDKIITDIVNDFLKQERIYKIKWID